MLDNLQSTGIRHANAAVTNIDQNKVFAEGTQNKNENLTNQPMDHVQSLNYKIQPMITNRTFPGVLYKDSQTNSHQE